MCVVIFKSISQNCWIKYLIFVVVVVDVKATLLRGDDYTPKWYFRFYNTEDFELVGLEVKRFISLDPI